MSRVFRILRTSLTILSLLLFFATTSLWIRGYSQADELEFSYPSSAGYNLFRTRSQRGELDIIVLSGTNPIEFSFFTRPARKAQNMVESWRNSGTGYGPIAGVGFVSFVYVAPTRVVTIPHWLPAILFAILPALKLRAILRDRKLHGTRGFEVITKAESSECPSTYSGRR